MKYYYITYISKYDKTVLLSGSIDQLEYLDVQYFTDVVQTDDPLMHYSQLAEITYRNENKLLYLLNYGEITKSQYDSYWLVPKDV